MPLGMRSWFEGARAGGSLNVVEMDWGEEVEISDDMGTGVCESGKFSSTERVPPGGDDVSRASVTSAHGPATSARPPLTIVCVPCQHWCKRTPTDTNQCLWSSWIAKTNNLTYFFGGDTGYCGDIFRRTGELYPVDLSAVPIAAYGRPEERWFHKPNHMNPEEAVQCHVDLRSKQSVGVHWGTFKMTGEPFLEPPARLAAAVTAAGLHADEFVTLGHGETRVFDVVRPGSGERVAASRAT